MSSIARKLAEVIGAVDSVPKNGRNDFHSYDYATEADVLAAIRSELSRRMVCVTPRVSEVAVRDWTNAKGKVSLITTFLYTLRFTDGETGEWIESTVIGSGEDSGDKGAYKGLTGAQKYALLKTFLIPTGDDPEGDVARANTTATATPVAATDTPPTPAPEVREVPAGALGELAHKIYETGLGIGKHKGESFNNLPANYLEWIVDKYGGKNPQYADQDAAAKEAARYELARRDGKLPTSGVEGLAVALGATISDEDIPF